MTNEPLPTESSEDGPPGWPPWFETFVLPYTRDSSLLVVWLVLLAHVVMVLAAAQIFAIRDRHPAGMVGMAFLLLATAELARVERSWHHKFGGMTATALACWLCAAGLAVVVSRAGIF